VPELGDFTWTVQGKKSVKGLNFVNGILQKFQYKLHLRLGVY